MSTKPMKDYSRLVGRLHDSEGTDADLRSAAERFDQRHQPGWMISTFDLDTLLEEVNRSHDNCPWDADGFDEGDPNTWHETVCPDSLFEYTGHGKLASYFGAPAQLIEDFEDGGSDIDPAIAYGYVTAATNLHVIRELRALRDEQAARHEEMLAIQRGVLSSTSQLPRRIAEALKELNRGDA